MVDLYSVVEAKCSCARIVHEMVFYQRDSSIIQDWLLVDMRQIHPFGANGPDHIGQSQYSASRPVECRRGGRVVVDLFEVLQELIALDEAECALDRMEVSFGEHLCHLSAWEQMWIDIVL